MKQQTHSGHKRFLFVFLILILLAAVGAGVFLYIRFLRVSYRPDSYAESAEPLSNPYCGYFHLYGYRLSEDGTEPVVKWSSQMLEHDHQQLILLQINLRNYSDAPLSDSALEQLDCLLSQFTAANKQLILRFLYDWDGKAKETEPASIEQIEAHMSQTAPVVNRYAGHILMLQGVYTGNCGEMNGTNYGSAEDISRLMDHQASVTDPRIYLAVRTPSHLRTILANSSLTAASGSNPLTERLGLYNDGMLGSVYDLGTYDDTSFEDRADTGEKGTREEEIAYQNERCMIVPNGGETVLDNPYSDFENAVSDLSDMHVSYLSCDHDAAVLNKWKSSVYSGNDCYDGMSGYDYIGTHLGYRYVLRASALTFDPLWDETASLSLTIENVGFAPAYRSFSASVTLTNTQTAEFTQIPLAIDTTALYGKTDYTVTLPLRELPKGTYTVFLTMTDPDTGLPIYFANTAAGPDIPEVTLGTLTVS